MRYAYSAGFLARPTSRARSSTRTTPAIRFEVLEIDRLHGHEQIRPALLEELTAVIQRDGYIRRPILVADGEFVVLDGHHRLEVLRVLGCRRIPAYVVDYFSRLVDLTTWPDAVVSSVTKEEVIRRGVTGDRFPPKTTRHRTPIELKDRPTNLQDLR
ncbi:MAG TPA: ParB N-terminal domain-containing protein [Thermoplasmata archaeon]|nr:ParB N-terminal domain-containing protein [Thermoplasmata archaeon]